MKIYNDVTELIGNTPIIRLNNLKRENNIKGNILAKVESFNPAGSSKDRVAKQMIESAEKQGLLKENSVIIEPTSGNTGIGLACVSRVKGYRVILTMPDTMSVERRNLLKAYGAEIVLTEGAKGMQGAIDKAEELKNSIPNSFIPGQFTNIENVNAHKLTTGPEIWEDTEGKIDIFVAGVGTGGTLTGVGEYLKEKNPDIRIIAVEPTDSPLLSRGKAGAHGIQGIGANFVPDILNRGIYDEIFIVDLKDAFYASKELVKWEGILTGISSGACLFAGMEIGKREENIGKNIVCLLPDTGERYLSTPMFD